MSLLRKGTKIFTVCFALIAVICLGVFSASAREVIDHDGRAVSCARIHGHANMEYCEAETTYLDYDDNTDVGTPVYHFSRARMEQDVLWWTNIIKDSGRKWDDDNDGYTFATTEHEGCTSNEYVARTYYSKDD